MLLILSLALYPWQPSPTSLNLFFLKPSFLKPISQVNKIMYNLIVKIALNSLEGYPLFVILHNIYATVSNSRSQILPLQTAD